MRRVMTLSMTRAALSALPGLEIKKDDDRFAEALKRLEEADKSTPVSIWDRVPKRP